jgi:hypothetical protein
MVFGLKSLNLTNFAVPSVLGASPTEETDVRAAESVKVVLHTIEGERQ